jgi:hypothetical protein
VNGRSGSCREYYFLYSQIEQVAPVSYLNIGIGGVTGQDDGYCSAVIVCAERTNVGFDQLAR